MPDVTSLDFTDCTHLTDTGTMVNLTNCSKLTTLSLKGCSQMSGTINLAGATSLTTLDLEDTTLNVNIPENSVISLLKLG